MTTKTELEIFIRNWLIAASSVVAARTVTAPLERVKIILQTQALSPHFDEMEVQPYKNAGDALFRISREQGLLSFWRGNAVNLCRHLPSAAFSFAFNDLFKAHLLKKSVNNASFWNRLLRHMLCGALAGVTTVTIVQPLIVCQTLITSDIGGGSNDRRFAGISDCLRNIYSQGGLRAMYTGYTLGVLGMSTYRSVYFGLFASFKEYFESGFGVRAPFIVAWSTAQVVTLMAGLIAYPLDTLSRTQQTVSLSSRKGYIKIGPMETARYLIQTKGAMVLYKGLGINILRSIGGALIIVAYDEIQFRLFTQDDINRKSLVSLKHHQMEDTIRRTSWPKQP